MQCVLQVHTVPDSRHCHNVLVTVPPLALDIRVEAQPRLANLAVVVFSDLVRGKVMSNLQHTHIVVEEEYICISIARSSNQAPGAHPSISQDNMEKFAPDFRAPIHQPPR